MSPQEAVAFEMVQSPDVRPYVVRCSACPEEFDASSAGWCCCVTADPTLVCHACGSCFCKSPLSYRREFWRGAPAYLRNQANTISTPPAPRETREAELVPGRPVVLIVDDSPVARYAAVETIRGLGYNVIVANDGVQGLELARRYRPQLVLTDALMPKMDGREMCRRIKEDPECAGTRVYVMTALYTNVRYRNEAHKVYKADGFLEKPFALADLCVLLERELEATAA